VGPGRRGAVALVPRAAAGLDPVGHPRSRR
jgi:hypothetical protein